MLYLKKWQIFDYPKKGEQSCSRRGKKGVEEERIS
jgi:hypothetical protein